MGAGLFPRDGVSGRPCSPQTLHSIPCSLGGWGQAAPHTPNFLLRGAGLIFRLKTVGLIQVAQLVPHPPATWSRAAPILPSRR